MDSILYKKETEETKEIFDKGKKGSKICVKHNGFDVKSFAMYMEHLFILGNSTVSFI